MCISSNWVNDAQDSIAVKKFHDFQNSLIPNGYGGCVLENSLNLSKLILLIHFQTFTLYELQAETSQLNFLKIIIYISCCEAQGKGRAKG